MKGSGHGPEEQSSEPVQLRARVAELEAQVLRLTRERDADRRAAAASLVILNALSDVIVAYDLDLRLQWANEAAAAITGQRPEDLLGHHCHEIWHLRPEPCPKCPVEQARDTGQPQVGEISGPAGKTWQLRSYPVKDQLGEVVALVEIAHDITERKRSEEALRASLEEKEVLLREVHHRVKNNLAAIIALLDMQCQLMNDAAAAVVLAEVGGRIRSMALIHEKLYWSENLAQIGFVDYLQALISHLRTSFTATADIRWLVRADTAINLDAAIPCGMIVNELVTNALKYAFPDCRPRPGAGDCEITVSLDRDGNACTLVVADNGVGLPATLDWTTTKTLGLRLVRMLGQHQLGGSIELDRTAGTRFVLRFSIGQRSG
jgi:PAS domain S-box-containing protein